MPATIAAVSAPAAPAASSTAPVQTSAGTTPATSDAKTPASKPPETPTEKAQRLRIKAKFDGKEEELDLGEEDVTRYVQKTRHYERTRGEFDKQRQDFDAQMAALTENPEAFLRQRGIDLENIGRQAAARQEQLKAMDPVQRELAEAKAELERFKSEGQKRAETEAANQKQQAHTQLVTGQAKLLGAAIAASGLVAPLPPTATAADKTRFAAERGYLMKLYGEVQEMALHNGEPDLSPEQLASAGERLEGQRFEANIKSRLANPAWRAKNAPVVQKLAAALVGQLQGPELVELLGREAVTRVTRESLTALRKSPIPVIAEAPLSAGQSSAPVPRMDTAQSMFGQLDKLVGA